MSSPQTPPPDVFPSSDDFQKQALVSGMGAYEELYAQSIKDPEAFWAKQAERLHWFKKWDSVSRWDFVKGEVAWFEGGKLNVAYNCLDRHLDGPRRNKAALIWEGDSPHEQKTLTYQQLHRAVCRFANVLKRHGVKKGDRVTLYLPMILELPIAMLACARIGAVHTVVFGGFSSKSLKERVLDSGSKIIITADQGRRGGRVVPLKENVDRALEDCPDVARVIVARNTGINVEWDASRDKWWHTEVNDIHTTDDCPAEPMDAEDPLFILYTSGSTGKPKGVLHTTGGYLLYTAYTHELVFDLKEDDTFWCTADMGWVTGHSYVTYGPLANGATSLVFEGVPNYPDWGRFWDVVDKHHVTILYTAPTAIRAIAKAGDEPVKKRKRTSLRLLGSVGEPINPQAWRWYHDVVGEGRCPIVDTWWQTETGGILISALPGAIPQKPGSATLPFFGIEPAILDTQGNEITGPGEGSLVIKTPWPGLMRGVYGEPDRFRTTYFQTFPGYYFSGDGARRDEDGYYWITGRIDDVINVSGHRMGTAEIESALVAHPSVAEAAVVGYPHDVKGQGIYAYVTVKEGAHAGSVLEKELVEQVRSLIGPLAAPDVIHFSPNLPKTRSGKIMRRLLRKIAASEFETLGDTSTLADPSVVDQIIEEKKRRFT